jgi:hypothetical protein
MQQLPLMQDKTGLVVETTHKRSNFMTIDDLSELAQKLVDGLNTLGERKHPLSIRRGVRRMPERKESKQRGEMLKTAAKTYFFDVKETREGKPYLIITESRIKGEGQKSERSSIIVFQENLDDFAKLVTQVAEKIGQSNENTL